MVGIISNQPATLAAGARRIWAAFEAGQMPAAIAAEIAAAYTALGEPQGKSACDLPVAMRFSATAEDLPELFFAG